MSDAATKRKPWMKFYPADWQADEPLRMCSLSARGLWIEMVATMHKSSRLGYLLIAGKSPTIPQIAVSVGSDVKTVTASLKELESWQVFSRDEQGVIYSRRMLRDQDTAEKNTTDGHGGGNPNLRRGVVPKAGRERRYRRSDSPQKTARILAKSDGCCHWCKKVLQQDTPGHDFFHVDHVLAICDGGGNDESNLVAACARCNHDRARKDYSDPKPDDASDPNRGNSDPNLRIASDPKAQRLEARSQSLEQEKSGIGLTASPQPEPAEAPALIHDSRQIDLVEAVAQTAKVVRVGHDPAEAVVLWNAMAAAHGLPQVQRLHEERKRHLQARLRECGGIEGWRIALDKLAASPWHLGQNDRGWRADIDYVLKPGKFARLMESVPSKPASQPAKPANGWDQVFDTIREFNA